MFNKVHNVKILISFLSLCLFINNLFADITVVNNDFTFSCNESSMTATLTKYSGNNVRVTVPSTASRTVTERVYDSNGRLEYDDEGNPKTRNVTYKYNVTSINSGFSGNTTITDVVLPSSVKSLSWAFNNCTSLKSINLDFIETIGNWAFADCDSLVSIQIPQSVKIIGEAAFANCDLLESVTIPSSVTRIEGYAFQNCVALKTVETPQSLNYLGTRAFIYCTALKSAIINGTNLTVEDGIFTGCTGLETATLGPGIISITDGWYIMGWWEDTYIGMFSYCSSLKTVDIQTTKVKRLPQYMFYESSVQCVKFAGGFSDIGSRAFWKCKSLETIEGILSPTSIQGSAFYQCTKFKGAIDLSRCESIGADAFYDCQSMDIVANLQMATTLGQSAFYNCSNLREIKIPKIMNIGIYTFFRCSSLTEVSIPNGVTNIGYRAFLGCSSLKSIEFPSSLKSLESEVVQDCSSLKTAIVDGDNLKMPSATFMNCKSLESVILKSGVTSIEQGSSYSGLWSTTYYGLFVGCTSLKTVDIQSPKITSLQMYMFKNSSIQHVKFAGTISSIGEQAFFQCKQLQTLEGDVRPTSIGSYAFFECNSLKEGLDLSRLSSIATYAMEDCYAFGETLYLPKITSIGSYAFSNCTGIKNLLFQNKMTTVPSYSFYQCSGITNIQLSSSVKRIENYAFQKCSKLAKLIIPENVAYIGTNSFQNCSSLKNVIFKGPPPSADKAFTSIASSPYGYYMPKYRNEWKTVIGSDGKWNGLIMTERPAPILSVDSANIPYDELTLKWTYSASDENIVYSLYRNTTDDFSTAACIGEGEEFNKKLKMNGNTYVENKFMEIKPQTASLHYWIVAKDVVSGETETDHIETRRRFLLAVGYSSYGGNKIHKLNKGYPQLVRDAQGFRSICMSLGGFAKTTLLSNASATTDGIRLVMKNYSAEAQAGDIFVFYITTHGSDYGEKKVSYILTYDDYYNVRDLLTDIRMFSPGTVVIGILNTCHSYSLTGTANSTNSESADEARERIDNWLTNAGFAQCLGNVAWITSCGATQSAYVDNGSSYTHFGLPFILYGMQYGFADKTLTLLGNKYNCSDKTNDGLLDFLELGRYAKIFAVGRSDNEPSEVCLENEGLLSRIVINKRSSSPSYNQPVPPASVSASQGVFDKKIDINWDKVPSAQEYRIYRSEIGETTIMPKLVTRCYSNSVTSYSDIVNLWEVLVQREYEYYVQSVNPLGTSALSSPAIAWRGSESYRAFLHKYVDSLSYDESSSIEKLESTIAANGYTFSDSYVAGLDPTNETSKFTVNLSMKDGKPFVEWSPNLNTNGMIRNYIIWGKTNLTDEVWHSPTNDASRFFKVTVQLPEENE